MNWKQAARDNCGALFRVPGDEKKTEKWPDFKGDILVDGVKYWISGWARASEKTGKRYLSLALRRADEATRPTPAAKVAAHAPVSNDIPF